MRFISNPYYVARILSKLSEFHPNFRRSRPSPPWSSVGGKIRRIKPHSQIKIVKSRNHPPCQSRKSPAARWQPIASALLHRYSPGSTYPQPEAASLFLLLKLHIQIPASAVFSNQPISYNRSRNLQDVTTTICIKLPYPFRIQVFLSHNITIQAGNERSLRQKNF